MNWFKQKNKTATGPTSIQEFQHFNGSLESHQMALDQTHQQVEKEYELSSISTEYHLTVTITNESLTSRDLSLILDVLNYQAVHHGINFNMMLAMYELYFRLIGKKFDSKTILDGQIRRTVTVSECILKNVKNLNFSLWPGYVYELPSKLKEILSVGLMPKRVYGSRYRTWRPEKFLVIRAVPVDIQFLKRRNNSEPYSGYCKGYGESHPSAHRKHLKPSAEYDGDGSDPVVDEERLLFRRCTDKIHLLSEYMLIRYEADIEDKK